MESIDIVGVDTKSLIFDSFLRVDFKLNSSMSRNIKIEIFDTFFNIKFIPGEYDMLVDPGLYYWVGFDVDKIANLEKPNFKFGFRITMTCTDTGKILYEDIIKNNYKSMEMRNISREFPMDFKRIWIIGDSNVWTSFGGDDHRPTSISEYLPIRVGITSLSLNRFVSGDYMGLLESLPIRSGDIISLYLGEIDFRYTIHKVKDKGDIVELTYNLLNRYLSAIRTIKNRFDNEVIVMSPNPPMCDGHLYEDSPHTFISGTEIDRKFCWSSFNKFFNHINVDGVKYLDWTEEYTLNGLIDSSKLFSGNHHIKEYIGCIKNLEKFIQNI